MSINNILNVPEASLLPFESVTPQAIVSDTVSLDAILIPARVFSNTAVGPSIWTADTGTNYSIQFPKIGLNEGVSVFVSNTTGAMITIASNTDVTVSGTPTNLSNFNFWLVNQGVNTWAIYY